MTTVEAEKAEAVGGDMRQVSPLDMIDGKPVRVSVVGMETIDTLSKIVDSKKRDHLEAISRAERFAVTYDDRIKNNRSQIESLKNEIKEYQHRVKECKAEASKLKKQKIDTVDMARVYERLRGHKLIQGIVPVTDSRIRVFLAPVYTNAQIEDGSKARSRMFVACFSVVLEAGRFSTGNTVRIENISFPGLRHWSVNSEGQPCWGDWEDDMRTAWNSGDLYHFITLIHAYLSSNKDEAAYTRTYSYRAQRIETIKELGKELGTISKSEHGGRYAIYFGGDGNNRDLNEKPIAPMVGMVPPYAGSFGLRFIGPVDCNTYWNIPGDETSDRDWHVQESACQLLGEEQAEEIKNIMAECSTQSDDIQREIMWAWCKDKMEEVTPTVESLLHYLDTAKSVPYELIARPLRIKK